jgi:hypothetical protein
MHYMNHLPALTPSSSHSTDLGSSKSVASLMDDDNLSDAAAPGDQLQADDHDGD